MSRQPYLPATPDFESRVRESFSRQRVMHLIGAEMTRVSPGEVEIRLPYRGDLTQQDGFLHAGIVSTVVDSACGYAAFSLMPADASVLTVEFKINLLAPAKGSLFLARGRVMRPGRTITVCTGELIATGEGEERQVALMTATCICLQGRG